MTCNGEREVKFDDRIQRVSDMPKPPRLARALLLLFWLRGQDLNLRPSGYEPDELPGCSTPRQFCPDRVLDIVSEGYASLSRSGGDLLSHVLRRSTIGAAALNGRVRDGIGCFARARATRPGKRRSAWALAHVVQGCIWKEAEVCLLPDQIKPIEPLVPVN